MWGRAPRRKRANVTGARDNVNATEWNVRVIRALNARNPPHSRPPRALSLARFGWVPGVYFMSLRSLCLGLAASLAALTFAVPASAHLLIRVDKSTQRMTVIENGQPLYVWPVSTGVAQYDTPSGDFKPFRMEKDHFSKEWDDAPMPYSIFFTTEGHAIHGTNHSSIGRPASHGCVRLSVAHAAILWGLVKREKMANTEVVLTGEIPTSAPAVARAKRPPVGYGDDGDMTGAVSDQDYYRQAQGRRVMQQDDGQYYYVERNAPPRGYYYRDDDAQQRYVVPQQQDNRPFPFSLFGR